jgi:hypothetical protein
MWLDSLICMMLFRLQKSRWKWIMDWDSRDFDRGRCALCQCFHRSLARYVVSARTVVKSSYLLNTHYLYTALLGLELEFMSYNVQRSWWGGETKLSTVCVCVCVCVYVCVFFFSIYWQHVPLQSNTACFKFSYTAFSLRTINHIVLTR